MPSARAQIGNDTGYCEITIRDGAVMVIVSLDQMTNENRYETTTLTGQPGVGEPVQPRVAGHVVVTVSDVGVIPVMTERT